MTEPFMEFAIQIDGAGISDLSAPDGSVTIIPFGGRVDSPLFRGEIQPGAADVHTARYLFRGTDAAGKPCSLYVENIGRMSGEPGPIRAIPTFLTDSELLRDALRGKRFRSEVHGAPGGVRILIYEDGQN